MHDIHGIHMSAQIRSESGRRSSQCRDRTRIEMRREFVYDDISGKGSKHSCRRVKYVYGGGLWIIIQSDPEISILDEIISFQLFIKFIVAYIVCKHD